MILFDGHCIPRLVFRHKRLSELIERSPFDLSAHSVHQIQIEMQIVQRNQAKSENFFRLD